MLRRVALIAIVLAACRTPRTAREEADAVVARADALFATGNEASIQLAVPVYEDAFARWDRLGDRKKQADVAGQLGDVWDNLGDMTRARAWSARALDLYRQAGDHHGEAMALSWVGIADVHLDDKRGALAEFEAARDLAKQHADDPAYAYALLNIGFARNELEDWREAEAAITDALPIFERIGDRASVATCHNNLGNQYARLGNAEAALAQHAKALAIRVADNRKLDIGWSNASLAGIHLDLLGDARQALAKFATARDVWTEGGNRVGVPIAIAGMGRARAALGELEPALALFATARDGYRAVKAEHGVAEVTVDQADVLARLDRPEARATYEAGLAASRTAEKPSLQARALLGLARLDVRAREIARANRELDEGIAILEGLRARVIREEHRRSYFATVVGSYQLKIQLALANGELDAAFAASERARARTLVEALARAGGTDRPVATIDAIAARALVDADTALVSFVLDDAASHAFVVTPAGVTVTALPGRAVIEAAARRFLDAASKPSGGASAEASAAALSAAILDPLALAAPRIVVIPDGALHFVPFANLPGLRGREVVHLPSASALVELRQRPAAAPTLELAMLADPIFAPDDPRVTTPHAPAGPTLARLRWSRREADAVVALAPPARRVVYTDGAADREAVRGPDIARARIVHFATHALVDGERPDRTGLVVSQVTPAGVEVDGMFGLPDIERLHLAAELVVISGCRTALGREVRGEGIVGLVGGFLRAGARRVVASLWAVDDRATAELMIAFHRGLGAGQSPGVALLAAQRAIAADVRWRDPYYWAGFALYGDWR